MAAIAERLALAVGDDDLEWSEIRTQAVDHVAALSGASSLGSDIMRAKDHDAHALRRALHKLVAMSVKTGRRNKLPMSNAQAKALALVALQELIWPQCRTCNGARVVMVDQLKIECDSCESTGIHRYSDRERERLAGLKRGDFSKWATRYQLVLGIARTHDCAPAKAKERLG